MSTRVRTFRNVRARLFLAEEGLWYAGWTKHLAHDEARIRMKTFVSLPPHSPIVGECYGDGVRVRFTGNVVGQMGQDIAVKICRGLEFAHSAETVRVGVEGVYGTLSCSGTECSLLVTDVSPDSLGALASFAVPIGGVLELSVSTPVGDVRGCVSVVYCRREPGDDSHFRVGLRIAEMSRLDAARWSRFLEESTMV